MNSLRTRSNAPCPPLLWDTTAFTRVGVIVVHPFAYIVHSIGRRTHHTNTTHSFLFHAGKANSPARRARPFVPRGCFWPSYLAWSSRLYVRADCRMHPRRVKFARPHTFRAPGNQLARPRPSALFFPGGWEGGYSGRADVVAQKCPTRRRRLHQPLIMVTSGSCAI